MNPHHLSLSKLKPAAEALGRESDQTGRETENKTDHEGESAQTEAEPVYIDNENNVATTIVLESCKKCPLTTLTCKPQQLDFFKRGITRILIT